MMENTDNRSQVAVIEVIDGGPLKIEGKIELRDLKKNTAEMIRIADLCRCGRSKNKPFCDESHKK